jgi:phage major head subunit gpT-like protein
MAVAPAYNGAFATQLQEAMMGRGRVRLSDLYEQIMAIREDVVTTSMMGSLLLDGFRALLFNRFNGISTTWEQFTRREPSNKEEERYLDMARMGTLSTVAEGERYPRVRPELLPGPAVKNVKRGDILAVTEEMIRFDRVGMIRQLFEDQGRRAAQTLEEAAYGVLLTVGNYTATTADNDVGNNDSTNAFTAANLITAMTTLQTMKDRTSGRYLGVTPNTLIVGPSLQFAARQLINSPEVQRVGGTGSTDTTQNLYGTGTSNPFKGIIDLVVVSPYVHQLGGQWQWVLLDRNNGLVYQEVDPLQLLQATAQDASNEEYFETDVFRYRVRLWGGFGFLDQRFAYYSNTTTAPSVA